MEEQRQKYIARQHLLQSLYGESATLSTESTSNESEAASNREDNESKMSTDTINTETDDATETDTDGEDEDKADEVSTDAEKKNNTWNKLSRRKLKINNSTLINHIIEETGLNKLDSMTLKDGCNLVRKRLFYYLNLLDECDRDASIRQIYHDFDRITLKEKNKYHNCPVTEEYVLKAAIKKNWHLFKDQVKWRMVKGDLPPGWINMN